MKCTNGVSFLFKPVKPCKNAALFAARPAPVAGWLAGGTVAREKTAPPASRVTAGQGRGQAPP